MREMTGLISIIAFSMACDFSGVGGGEGGDGDGDAGADAALCPELQLVLSLDDEPLTVSNNSVVNRITDVVELDTAGSCGREALQLTWTVPDQFSGETGGSGESLIRVYQAVPGQGVITLDASDGTETVSTALHVTSIGLQQLPYAPVGNDNIEGMAIASGKLWLSAQNDGIYSLALDAPHAAAVSGTFDRENNLSGSIGRPRQLFADGDTVWVRNEDQRQGLNRFDASQTDPSNTSIGYADGASGNLEDLGYFPGGVRFTASNNLWTYDGNDFVEEVDTDAHAIAADNNRVWTGDDELRRVADGVIFDVVPGQDDGLRAILIHGDEVWAGGGDDVARIFNDEITRYVGVEAVRHFAAEPSGDIWAVTSQGLWRYQRVRDSWVHLLGPATGLQNDNLKSIAIDTSEAEPVIYVGTDTHLHALTLRFSPP